MYSSPAVLQILLSPELEAGFDDQIPVKRFIKFYVFMSTLHSSKIDSAAENTFVF